MVLVLREVTWAITLLAVFGASGCPRKPSQPTDLILVTLDTTRRDHLGAYGYSRPVSPHLDRFAEGADLYTRAYASSSWTVPTHASMLTGLHASDHGAHMSPGDGTPLQLRTDVETLGERLRKRGYATAGVVGAHTMHERFGFARGFDLYDAPAGEDVVASRPADLITRNALSWLDEQKGRPVFLFLNYFDPHLPYRPSASCHERFAKGVPAHGRSPLEWHKRPLDENLQLYDAEICFMDEQFGILLEGLRERRRMKTALIVVVADHGESFDPVDGISHGRTLNEELIRVPLFVKRPGQRRGNRVEEVFETRKLFHMLLGASKPKASEHAEDEVHTQELTVSELWRGDPDQPNPVLRALIRWPLKLVVPPGVTSGASRLYDLSKNGADMADIAAKRPAEREALESLLGGWVAQRGAIPGSPVELDPALVDKLRALGYLE